MLGTWPWNSSGVSSRPPLYSPYSWERSVGPSRSKETTRWVGFSSRTSLTMVFTKP